MHKLLGLIVILVNLLASIWGHSTVTHRIQSRLQRHPIQLNSGAAQNNGILMRNIDGDSFECMARLHPSKTYDAKKVKASNIPVLESIRGLCMTLPKDYWSYRICVGQHVTQFRYDPINAAIVQEMSLGAWSGTVSTTDLAAGKHDSTYSNVTKIFQTLAHATGFVADDLIQSVSARNEAFHTSAFSLAQSEQQSLFQVYSEGLNCPEAGRGTFRNTLVEFRCCPTPNGELAALVSVYEPISCRYFMLVCTKLLCSSTQSPPNLSLQQPTFDSYRAAVQAVQPLQGSCFTLHDSYWSYELCLGESMSQFHAKYIRTIQENDDSGSSFRRIDTVRFDLGRANHSPIDDMLAINLNRQLFTQAASGLHNESLETDSLGYVTGNCEPNFVKCHYEPNAPERTVHTKAGVVIREGLVVNKENPRESYLSIIYTNGTECIPEDVNPAGSSRDPIQRQTEVRIFCAYGKHSQEDRHLDSSRSLLGWKGASETWLASSTIVTKEGFGYVHESHPIFGQDYDSKSHIVRKYSQAAPPTVDAAHNFELYGSTNDETTANGKHALISVEEGPLCHYVATLVTPALCFHPAFAEPVEEPPTRFECERYDGSGVRFGGWRAPVWRERYT